MDRAAEASAVGAQDTAGDRGGGNASIDGFSLPVPEPKRPAIGKLRESDPKKDFSLFTLDYAFRKVGGREAAIALARLAGARDERLRGIVRAYAELTPSQKKRTPKLIEALCEQNDVDPSEFLGICTAVAHRYQLDTSAILASVELENIVKAGIEQAKTPLGTADRKLFFEHSQFTPQKGAGVAIQINNSPQGQGTALPEFRSLSEIALQAISRVALPPHKEEEEKGDYIDVEPTTATDLG
jgi:hypothetical protein